MKSAVVICFLLSIHFPVYAAVITGGETVYRVAEGDSLLLISAKFGVDMGLITRKNNLNPAKPLHPGQELRLEKDCTPDRGKRHHCRYSRQDDLLF